MLKNRWVVIVGLAAAAVAMIVLAANVSDGSDSSRIAPADQVPPMSPPTVPDATTEVATTQAAATTEVATTRVAAAPIEVATTQAAAPIATLAPSTSAAIVAEFVAGEVEVPAGPGLTPADALTGPERFSSVAASVGPNGFVDVITDGKDSHLRRSIDGVNWTTTAEFENNPFNTYWETASVAANDLGYLATGAFGWTFSADGTDWLDPRPLTGLATSTDSEFIMVDAANGDLTLWRSTSGTGWGGTPRPARELPRPGLVDRRDPIIDGIATDGTTIIVALADGGAQHQGYLWSTTDGATWTEVFVTDEDYRILDDWIYDITYGPAGWVAIGWECCDYGSGTVAWTSIDAINWTQLEVGTDLPPGEYADLYGVAANDTGYLAVGIMNNEPVAWHSTNGTDWTIADPQTTDRGYASAVTAFNGSFLLRGYRVPDWQAVPAGWWFTPDT